MTGLAAILTGWLQRGDPVVLVTVAATRGSTPREVGACMLVGAAETAGTIGGGRLEWEAIRHARMLTPVPGGPVPGGPDLAGVPGETALDLPLGPALGQCCGGAVTLRLERAGPATAARLAEDEQRAAARQPALLLFGAGHVGRALAPALAPLPWRVTWIDSRADAFPAVPPAGVACRTMMAPADAVGAAAAGTLFLIVTHSHPLDFTLAEAALRRGDAGYVGMIGSVTKRRRFERLFRSHGGDGAALDRLRCPIGAGLSSGALIPDKSPAVIAALTAAEMLIAMTGHDRAAVSGPAPASPSAVCSSPVCPCHI